MMTIDDIVGLLRLYDTTQIIEALALTEEDIIERFIDRVEELQDELRQELE